jgi:hypothetical protein
MRGLPIFVFEETDVAQIVKEEGEAVQEAVEAEAVGAEAAREVSADMSTHTSELEEAVLKQKKEEAAVGEKEAIECECVHGFCETGSRSCHRCDSGWEGAHCDTPSSDETLQAVNTKQDGDFTADGLYQPRQGSGERKTGAATEIDEEKPSAPKAAEKAAPSAGRARKIDDDDVWGERAQEHAVPSIP